MGDCMRFIKQIKGNSILFNYLRRKALKNEIIFLTLLINNKGLILNPLLSIFLFYGWHYLPYTVIASQLRGNPFCNDKFSTLITRGFNPLRAFSYCILLQLHTMGLPMAHGVKPHCYQILYLTRHCER